MSTNGSPTLSANELNHIRELLTSFVEGGISIQQIQKGLRDYLFLDFTGSPARREMGHGPGVDLSNIIQVPLEKRHLYRILQRYIDGEITTLDLSNWAAFMFLSQLFVSEEDEPTQELVWDIIQQLITPMIFGGLNRDVAQQYLESLTGSDSAGSF